MGKPYQSELMRIPATIDWASRQDIAGLRNTLLNEFGGHNLVAIASGGSMVAAAFAALLHEVVTGRLARTATPLEAINRPPPRDTAAFLLSARGRNPDIRRVAEILPELGYDTISALSTARGSPLRGILSDYHATMHEFAVPGGRDGFLATNSLMATLVLLYRATMSNSGSSRSGSSNLATSHPTLKGSTTVLSNRTLVVLAQGWATPAAIDFESRFSEAALANVTVTDPRNFAHGRHNWLSLHSDDTGIVSLETQGSAREANRMIRLLPHETDVLRIEATQEGPAATVQLVRAVMELAGQVAEDRGIDPGRPSVPEYGRRLYRAGVGRNSVPRESTSIARKRQALYLAPSASRDELRDALEKFVRHLTQTSYCGLAVDYDGTLCPRNRRFDPLEPNIKVELNRLVEQGIVLGVASGRGSSVHERLREALDNKHWNEVVVGLYNGARVVALSEDVSDSADEVLPSLAAAHSRMRPLEGVLGFETVVRPYQISLRPAGRPSPSELSKVATEQLADLKDVSVVMSSHSVDIIPLGTSKTSVVDAILAKRDGCVLRIGDQGAGGGNDFELLNTGLSLSVDRVSSNLQTCWNLGAPGLVGPSLTLAYLRALRCENGRFHFDPTGLLANTRD